MISQIVLFVVFFSFAIGIFSIRKFIPKIRRSGFVVNDRYKKDNPEIPNLGGLLIFFSSFISLALLIFIASFLKFLGLNFFSSELSSIDFSIMLVITTFTLYGLIDDLFNIGRSFRNTVLFPLIFSFPLLISLNPQQVFIPFIGNFNLDHAVYLGITYGDMLELIVIPLYIVVVVNLVNLFSGFNGQQTGTSLIILFSLIIKCIMDENNDNLLLFSSITGSVLAFWFFNKYPSKIFEGNVGSFFIGSTIGCLIIVKGYYFLGLVILLPHIVNFLVDMWYLANSKGYSKFGKIDDQGFVLPPPGAENLNLKFILTSRYRMKEKSAVQYLYLITFFFSILFIIIP